MKKPVSKIKRLPSKTWDQHPSTLEETLKAMALLQKWEAKTGMRAGYDNGIIVTVKFCIDLCERVLELEKKVKKSDSEVSISIKKGKKTDGETIATELRKYQRRYGNLR